MYNGYLSLAGTEIANADRVASYVHNMAPGLQFKSCWESKDLGKVLGDAEYRTPALDKAPWFSEHRPASAKFLGFYPLAVSGIEDSTRDMTVTELVQDGAVFSQPRQASKEFRVRGLLLGTDGEGVDEGMRWLRGALQGSLCGGEDGCSGDELCYLGYLPSYCDYDEYPLKPVNWAWVSGENGGWSKYRNGNIASSTNGVRVNMPCEQDGAQYTIAQLIPGQWYRVALDVEVPDVEMSLSIAGHDELVAHREAGARVNVLRTPWVIDFQAQAETEVLRFVKNEGECEQNHTMRLYGLTVDRIPRRRMVSFPRFTPENFSEPASWDWIDNGDVPTHSQQIGGHGFEERIEFVWENTTGSSMSIGADSGAQRTIRGLVPGQEYEVYVKMEATSAAINPAIWIPNVLNFFTTSMGYDWYRARFTAKNNQHQVRISTETGFTLTGASEERIKLYYMRADRSELNDPMPVPDQALKAQRVLHGVTLLNGPNEVGTYRDDTPARIREVEFSMTAARPFIYSPTTNVLSSLNSTTFLIPERACSNGVPVRVNLYTNPEVADLNGGVLTNSALTSVNGTLAAATGPITGRPALQFTPNAGGNAYIGIPVDEPSLLEGHTYTVSVTMEQEAAMTAPDDPSGAGYIRWVDDSGEYRSERAIDTPGAQRLSLTFLYTSGFTSLRFFVGSENAADVTYWSDILFEEVGYAGSPFSGDTYNGEASTEVAWNGTADASTSTYSKANVARITDPDCATPPSAPQPPGIIPECVRDVDEWRRYWVEIPASMAGGWAESVPVINITTLDEIVRDVRIRFFASDGGDVTSLEGCDYCGEFFISYIPKKTTMTIDAINRTAIADVKGTGEQRVMHLVSDADYGPIDWPTMTCDTSYFMTVDIAPDEVENLDIALAVARKE